MVTTKQFKQVNWFPGNKPREINKSILALKYDYTEHIKLDIPQEDDWNNDLQKSLGLGKYKEQKQENKEVPKQQQEQEQGVKRSM